MTGPDGATSRGWFRFISVEPYRRFEVEDGFSDDAGAPSAQMPTMRMTFNFDATDIGSRFTSVTHFASVESMEQLVNMGMQEMRDMILGSGMTTGMEASYARLERELLAA